MEVLRRNAEGLHMKAFLVVAITLGSIFSSHGQVSNDDINNRSTLTLNAAPMTSTTHDATVEWDCVNKSMTRKCLVYHNDQWFTFTPAHDGRYFINLSVQSCSDLRGIQAIVIEGNPCQVSTYRLVTCIDQIRHAETYIQLDSAHANTPYLINIDGFLEDYCDFTIQFSSKPQGIPVNARSAEALSLTVKKHPSINVLKWRLTSDLMDSIESFEVNRISDDRLSAIQIATVSIISNTRGVAELEYFYRDTISTPVVGYEILGKMRDERRILLDKISTIGVDIEIPDEQMLIFELPESDKSQVHIFVVDPVRDVVLREKTLNYSAALDPTQKIYVGDFIVRGIMSFDVYVVNKSNRQSKKMQFKATEVGVVLQK
jgi:hypothetical protein